MSWQDELQTKSTEFLKEFSLAFFKSYGISLFLKIKKDVANDKPDKRKLVYTKPPRSAAPGAPPAKQNKLLHKGWVYIKRGEGIYSFENWQRVFLQERDDHQLDVFKTDKDTKPMYSIPFAGYKLETDVTQHYKSQGRTMADELDMEAPSVDFSRFSWALTHSVRPNYIFQMHKGKDPGACACFTSNSIAPEPENAGEEFAEKRAEWVRRFEVGMKDSCPRDTKTDVMGITFERVIKKLKIEIPELKDFHDDGTEGDILALMLYVGVLEASCKADIIEYVKNMPSMLRMQAWYKTRGIAFLILSKAVTTTWNLIQKQGAELSAKIEPTIRSAIEPILQKKGEIQKLIGEKIAQHLGPALSSKVSPFLQPLFSAMNSPLRDALKSIEGLFKEKASKIVPAGKPLTPETAEELMFLSRDVEVVKTFSKFIEKLISPLQNVVDKQKEVLEDVKIELIIASAESLLRETLNACAYTLIVKMNPPPPKEGEPAVEPMDFDQALTFVLEGVRHDVNIQLSNWCQVTICSTLIGAFRRNVDPHVMPLIKEMQDIIPEDLHEILNIESEYDDFVNIFLGEPIKKVIEQALPAA